MRGKAYAIMRYNDIVAIALSRQNAEEILMDYTLEDSYNSFIYYLNYWQTTIDVAMQEANEIYRCWHIREFNLV